ncbi:uncharacterized protein LOC135198935 [Macrobrachium nipponense]|uniref:uncharacterized protein LOC135198935 n=1 Tax=Macrobrachium nipponense TaxID=159736 RepID=UPI0030C846C1
MPKQLDFGTSNDGNTARRFFQLAETSSEILGIKIELLKNLHIILCTLSSGFDINVTAFKSFCINTAKIYVEEYNYPILAHCELWGENVKLLDLDYADDTAFICEGPEKMQRTLDCLVSEGRKVGLVLDSGKTEIVNMMNIESAQDCLIEEVVVEQVDKFTYLDLERYQTIGDTGDTYGHYGATLGASTLDAPYTTNESLDGTWAPHYSLDPNTSAVQDCFEDPALESVLRHLGERGGGIGESPYDVPGGLLFLEEPALPATDDQLESAGPTATVDSQQISASDVLVKMNASRKHRVRGPKNWEFLMRLLVHPTANPAIIGWEDEEEGIFRLRNPKVIAQLWASRNENSNDLSYNNFARGLRHHYKKGILIPIPERQLVYKCGQKALDYLNQIRCSQVPA